MNRNLQNHWASAISARIRMVRENGRTPVRVQVSPFVWPLVCGELERKGYLRTAKPPGFTVDGVEVVCASSRTPFMSGVLRVLALYHPGEEK